MAQAQTIEDRVREFVQKHFPLARKLGIHADEKWLESGMMDSLGVLDLVHFLEEEFSVLVSDDELVPENFGSVKAVAAFIRTKKGDS